MNQSYILPLGSSQAIGGRLIVWGYNYNVAEISSFVSSKIGYTNLIHGVTLVPCNFVTPSIKQWNVFSHLLFLC